MNSAIDEEPEVLGAEIGQLLASMKPAPVDILELQRQLLLRHADLGLEPTVSSEEVVESFYRCFMIHQLAERFDLQTESIPTCINSSHRATRRVCAARSAHRHHVIADDAWAAGWHRLQAERPEVNVRVPNSRSPKRADLYVVGREKVISFEFKYIGAQGLHDAAACAAQVRRHAANHALAFLVVYCGASVGVHDDALARLNLLIGNGVRLVGVHGPKIPVARATA